MDLSRLFSVGLEKIVVKINFFVLIFSSFFFDGTVISPFSKITFYNNLKIGKNCRISEGCVFRVPKDSELIIGDNCNFREFSQVMCREKTKTIFGDNCFIGCFCFISDQVTLGNNVILAPFCALIAGKHNFSSLEIPINKQGSASLPIEIGANVWLGIQSIIIGPSKIGANSIIGAGTIVKGDIPENSIVRGERKFSVSKRAQRE